MEEKMELLIGNKNYSSWSLRPWILLKHFSIDFSETMLLLNGDGWKENLIKNTPTGFVPVLNVDNIQIAETIAIIEYIADRFPDFPIWPKDIKQRALARAASAEMHAGFMKIRNAAPMNLRQTFPNRVDIDEIQSDLDRIENLWGQLLEKSNGSFLFGEFCAADAMFAPLATRLKTYHLPISKNIAQYVDNIHNLSAFIEWKDAALKEKWIVEEDEIDFIQGINDKPN